MNRPDLFSSIEHLFQSKKYKQTELQRTARDLKAIPP